MLYICTIVDMLYCKRERMLVYFQTKFLYIHTLQTYRLCSTHQRLYEECTQVYFMTYVNVYKCRYCF